MGLAKRWWMDMQEQQYEEDRALWIQEQLDDYEADESHEDWDHLSDEFDEIRYEQFAEAEQEFEDLWSVRGKTYFEIFKENMVASREILDIDLTNSSQKNLLVMLHAHVVSSVEGYLSSIFIEKSLSSDEFIRLLVENDPEFAKRKFTVKEIFTKHENLKSEISKYLKDLIFHDIAKVKPMFYSVFKIDFGDISWLGNAISLRHDCVHRAGYDKDGNEVSISKDSINILVSESTKLIEHIERELPDTPEKEGLFW